MPVPRLTRGNLQFFLGLVLGITASFMLTSYRQLSQSAVRVNDDRAHPGKFGLQAALQHSRDLDEHELHELMEHGDAAGGGGAGAKAVKFEDLHVHHGE